MAKTSPSLFRRLSKILLGVLSGILLVAIVIQLAMIGAILWLGSSGGGDWVRGQLVALAQGSGYEISLGTASLTLVDGLSLSDITVSDEDGVFLSADRVSARASLTALAVKRLGLSVQGGTVHLIRLPVTTESAEESPLSPFIMPDMYVTSVSLDKLSVKRLHVDAEIAGRDMLLSPKIQALVSWSEHQITAEVKSDVAQPEQVIAWLPEHISAEAGFDASSLSLNFKNANVKGASFTVQASGTAGLGEGGLLQIDFDAAIDDLQPLTGLAGRAEIKAKVTGATDDPLLAVTGNIDLEEMKTRGLALVEFKGTAKDLNSKPEGSIAVASLYQEKPVTLEADYIYEAPSVAFSHIAGTAPDTGLKGSVTYDTETALTQGSLNLNIDSFMPYEQMIGLPVRGKTKADIVLQANDKVQGASAQVTLKDGVYNTVSVRALNVEVSIPDVALMWPQTLDLQAEQLVVSPDVVFSSLSAKMADKGRGDTSLSILGTGQAMMPFKMKGSALFSGLQNNQVSADDIDMMISSGASSLMIKGKASQENLDVTASSQKFSMEALPLSLPEQVASAQVSGDIHLTGTPALPVIDANLDMSPLSIGQNIPSVTLSATGRYAEKNLNVAMTGKGEGIRALTGSATLPATLSLYPVQFEMPDTTPLTGSMSFDLNGAAMAALLLPPDHLFSGTLKGQFDLGGTLASPVIGGNAALSGGTYHYEPYGVKLQDLSAKASLSGSSITLDGLRASDGSAGRLSGQGVFDLSEASKTKLSLTMTDFHLLNSKVADGLVSADVVLSAKGDGYLLSGSIRPGETDVIIPEQFKSDIPQLNIIRKEATASGSEALAAVALDMKVSAPNRIFVRGWGLDAEFGGDLEVTGALDAPQVNGDFKSIRGRYEEFGKRFALARANLRFQGSVPPSPYLDIEASTTAGDVTASVLMTGSVSKPKINFSSAPSLPEDEVLSRILFGKTMNRITPFQAIQLAQTLQRFSGKGGGGLDPLGTLRSATGLDDISVETDGSGDTTVGVGKYLTDKVYLQVKKGKGETSGAASLQVEVTPNVSVESEVGQDAEAGAGVFWKWDY